MSPPHFATDAAAGDCYAYAPLKAGDQPRGVLKAAGGAIAAFCCVWVVLDELHINNVAVRPEFRRRGFARMLLEHVMDEATRRGATRATLEVRRSNVGALRLYERLGFSVAGVRPNYYTNPVEDALILWRCAPPPDGTAVSRAG